MELAQKLTKTVSVLRWVTTYNKYMRFFLRNFGDASAVFGARHVDNMVDQVKHVHKIVFSATNGSVLEAVRAKIAANQPAFALASTSMSTSASLPAGWIYWPLDLGGLGLFNPLLELWSLKQALVAERGGREPFRDDKRRFEVFYEEFTRYVQENGLQRALKTRFRKLSDMHRVVSSTISQRDPVTWSELERDETLAVRSFQAFLDKIIEYQDILLLREYSALLLPVDIAKHPKYAAAKGFATTSMGDVLSKTNYWMWVAYVYEAELWHSFGTTSLVPRELVPAQLVEQIKKAGIYWS